LQFGHHQDCLEVQWKAAVVAGGGFSLTVQTGVYESDLHSFWTAASTVLH